MDVALGVALLVAVAATIIFAMRFLRRPASHADDTHSRDVLEEDVVAVPCGEASTSPELPETEPKSMWTAELTAAVLDEAARLRLVDDLVLLAAPWTIALLRRAYEEEQSPHMRSRIEAALASSGEPIATVTAMREGVRELPRRS